MVGLWRHPLIFRFFPFYGISASLGGRNLFLVVSGKETQPLFSCYSVVNNGGFLPLIFGLSQAAILKNG